MDKYMALLFVIIPALYFAYTLYKKNKKGWHILWSAGVPKQPTKQGSGWYVDIPKAPGHLNYIQNFSPKDMRVGQTLTARVKVVGSGVVAPEYGLPANASIILGRKGDKGTLEFESYRWYSLETIPLVEGEYTLSVPLTHDKWTSMMGYGNASGFAAALKNLEYVGIVTGSDGGRGHGVHTTESARLELISLDVA